MKKTLLLSPFIFLFTFCQAATWNVGPTQSYTLPSQVKNLVNDGDTILIDGGVYLNDATKWNNKDLVFIGLGIGANRTILRNSINIGNNKGIFVFESPGTCDNAYLENLVFDGAQVSDGDGGNGAGIRFQAKHLTVTNCKFMNCQNGILEGHNSVTNSNVTIENSEFENNGYQQPNNSTHSGYKHNIYISASTDSLLVRNNYFHNPRGQANSIKTRAQKSFILYNYIDEENGYGSWEINIAQGGLNVIMGNVIIQGPSGANHGVIGYDAAINNLQDFYFINNTVINKYVGIIKYFNTVPASGINTFKIYNNIFASVSGANNTTFTGNIPGVLDSSNNIFATDYLNLGFTNPALNDYSLTASATQIIDKGTNAGSTNTAFALTPISMYDDFTNALINRTTSAAVIDLGAYEFLSNVGLNEKSFSEDVILYPNPSSGILFVSIKNQSLLKNAKMEIINLQGKIIYQNRLSASINSINLSQLSAGTYFAKLSLANETFYRRIQIY